MVLAPQPPVTRPITEERPHGQVERAERDRDATVPDLVRVGQSDGQLVVLVPDGGPEEERWLPVQIEYQAGQVAGALVVDAFFAESARPDVAEVIEHRERVPVFEDPGPVIGQTGSSQDVIRATLGLSLWRRAAGTGTVVLRVVRLEVGH